MSTKAAAPKTPKSNPTETEDPKGKSGSKAVVSNKKRDADSDRKRKKNECEDDESCVESIADSVHSTYSVVSQPAQLCTRLTRRVEEKEAEVTANAAHLTAKGSAVAASLGVGSPKTRISRQNSKSSIQSKGNERASKKKGAVDGTSEDDGAVSDVSDGFKSKKKQTLDLSGKEDPKSRFKDNPKRKSREYESEDESVADSVHSTHSHTSVPPSSSKKNSTHSHTSVQDGKRMNLDRVKEEIEEESEEEEADVRRVLSKKARK